MVYATPRQPLEKGTPVRLLRVNGRVAPAYARVWFQLLNDKVLVVCWMRKGDRNPYPLLVDYAHLDLCPRWRKHPPMPAFTDRRRHG